MKTRTLIKSEESSFLGIGTGKKAKAEADAAVRKIQAETAAALQLEQAKRDTLTLQLAQAKAGFDPVKDATTAEIEKSKIITQSDNTIYYIFGLIVIVVMIGLYFLKKRK